MADIKNFSMAGVGSNVQFGKRGAKLVQTNGDAFAFRNAGETAFASVKVATPTVADHAATKGYVDSVVQGLDPKASVVAATTANITLSGEQTVDGVAVVAGNRVLVKNQTLASENGIYVVASGAWTRAIDANSSENISAGLFTFVEKGSTQSDTGWVLGTDNPITVGTTDLTFIQFSSAGVSQAGAGLSKTGTTFDVNAGNGIEIVSDNVEVKIDGTTLTKSASGLKVADATIQRITDLENGVATLDKTQIEAADGTKVDTDTVAGKVTIDAAGKRVATFQSGTNAIADVVFDNADATKIVFGPQTTAGTEQVDLHLIPQGNGGAVYIGDADTDGVIQADVGQNLTLAGGDDVAGQGGNLVLRSGAGATANDAGSVEIQNGAGNTLVSFSSPSDSTAAYNFTAGTTSATMQAVGSEANVDLVMQPKGTGKFSVSNAIVADVATPVVGTDGVNKDYVDTAIETISTTVQQNLIGSLQTREIAVSTATTNIGAMIKGRVRRAMLQITTPYSAGTQLTIGTAATPDLILDAATIDETTVGLYDLNVSVNFSTDTQLRVFVNGGPASGAAILVIEYIQG